MKALSPNPWLRPTTPEERARMIARFAQFSLAEQEAAIANLAGHPEVAEFDFFVEQLKTGRKWTLRCDGARAIDDLLGGRREPFTEELVALLDVEKNRIVRFYIMRTLIDCDVEIPERHLPRSERQTRSERKRVLVLYRRFRRREISREELLTRLSGYLRDERGWLERELAED